MPAGERRRSRTLERVIGMASGPETTDQRLSVLELAESLAALTADQFTPEGVFELLCRYRVQPASLEPYLRFDPRHYTRNLIYADERFEMLALCWEPGQRSPIHNHAGQQCWMLVPVGLLLNQNYRVLELDEERQTCRLAPTGRCSIDPAHPLRVDPDEPIHRVENPFEDGKRSVSLHIYSLPYDRCLVYSLETGRYGEVELKYTPAFAQPLEPAVG